VSAEQEKKSALALFSNMNSDSKKMRQEPSGDDSVLNVRKAIRTTSKGQGGVALAKKLDSGKKKLKR
jgi:regulator of ribosome biosynthesis